MHARIRELVPAVLHHRLEDAVLLLRHQFQHAAQRGRVERRAEHGPDAEAVHARAPCKKVADPILVEFTRREDADVRHARRVEKIVRYESPENGD